MSPTPQPVAHAVPALGSRRGSGGLGFRPSHPILAVPRGAGLGCGGLAVTPFTDTPQVHLSRSYTSFIALKRRKPADLGVREQQKACVKTSGRWRRVFGPDLDAAAGPDAQLLDTAAGPDAQLPARRADRRVMASARRRARRRTPMTGPDAPKPGRFVVSVVGKRGSVRTWVQRGRGWDYRWARSAFINSSSMVSRKFSSGSAPDNGVAPMTNIGVPCTPMLCA